MMREVYSDDEAAKPAEPQEKEKKVVQLEPVFFKVGDTVDEDEINHYRMKYREFRTGKAFGAVGEIEKPRLRISDTVDSVIPPFIAKLSSMLKNSMYDEYVGWTQDGKTVSVKKVNEFSSVILPKYFKHSNFTSFLRQLNMYGFHTARQGRNWRHFKNDLFVKDKPAMYSKIKRKANTVTLNAVKSNNKSAKGNDQAGKGKKRKKAAEKAESAQVDTLLAELQKSNARIAKLEKQVAGLIKHINARSPREPASPNLAYALSRRASSDMDPEAYNEHSSRNKRQRRNSGNSNHHGRGGNSLSSMHDDSPTNSLRLRYNSSAMFLSPNAHHDDDEFYQEKDESTDFGASLSFSH